MPWHPRRVSALHLRMYDLRVFLAPSPSRCVWRPGNVSRESSRVLEDGDIVAIDVSVFIGGHHGDTCRTFLCGNVDPATQQLVRVTKAAMNAAIKKCGPGVQYNVIGKTIEDMCDKYGARTS